MYGLPGVSRFGFSAGFCWSSLRVLLNLLDDLPSNDEKEKSTLVDSPAAVATGVGELLLNRLKALVGGGGGARCIFPGCTACRSHCRTQPSTIRWTCQRQIVELSLPSCIRRLRPLSYRRCASGTHIDNKEKAEDEFMCTPIYFI